MADITHIDVLGANIQLEEVNDSVSDFDQLGLKEAVDSNQRVLISRSIDSIPNDLEIWNTGQGGDVTDWWNLIKSNSHRWNTSVIRLPSGDVKLQFEFTKPDFVVEKDGMILDTRLVRVDTKDLTLTEDAISDGWKVEPISEYDWHPSLPDMDKDHMIRGMNDEEMREILNTGFVSSRGDVVKHLGEQTNGVRTYFYPATNMQGSFYYAARGREFNMAMFDKPSFLIALRKTPDIKSGRGDLYSESPIPAEQITRIYEIRPVSSQGNLTAQLTRIESEGFGTIYALENVVTEGERPKVEYAYREVGKYKIGEIINNSGNSTLVM